MAAVGTVVGDRRTPAVPWWSPGAQPGGRVVLLGTVAVTAVAACDLALGGRLSLFFDLGFVTLCLGLPVLVRPADLFTAAVLPPLLMGGLLVLLALLAPAGVGARDDTFLPALIAGLSAHSVALTAGYAVCLAVLAVRCRTR